MNSSTQQRVLRTRTPSRFVILSLNFYYSNVATLLTEKRRTRACRQIKSVKVRSTRRVGSRGAFFASTSYSLCHIRVLAWICMFPGSMSPMCLCYVRFLGKTEVFVPQCSLKSSWSTNAYQGTMRSLEIHSGHRPERTRYILCMDCGARGQTRRLE
jgi:hypothetical protein